MMRACVLQTSADALQNSCTRSLAWNVKLKFIKLYHDFYAHCTYKNLQAMQIGLRTKTIFPHNKYT